MQNNSKSPHHQTSDYGIQFPQMMPLNFDTFFEMQRPAFAAMADFNSKFVEGLTTFNNEWVGFVNSRLQEDLGVCRELAACESIQDVYSVYNEFYQTAVKQYQEEADRMTRIGKTIADDTIHSVQAVQDKIEDISQKTAKAA